jgi:hypothetical protein
MGCFWRLGPLGISTRKRVGHGFGFFGEAATAELAVPGARKTCRCGTGTGTGTVREDGRGTETRPQQVASVYSADNIWLANR